MKKIILCLILLGSLNYNHYLCAAHTNTDAIATLTREERAQLKLLYQTAAYKPDFEKQEDINFDYYLALLDKHTKIIEHKIRTQKNGWATLFRLKEDQISTAVVTVIGSFIAHRSFNELSTGIFNDVRISCPKVKNALNNLSSLRFNRATRKKLDAIEVKHTTIVTRKMPEYYTVVDMINGLKKSDRQKYDYFIRQTALTNARYMLAGATLLPLLAIVFLIGPKIYKAMYYAEHLTSRLERDRNLSQILRKEKMNRLAALAAHKSHK
jgi:hypothetical protein